MEETQDFMLCWKRVGGWIHQARLDIFGPARLGGKNGVCNVSPSHTPLLPLTAGQQRFPNFLLSRLNMRQGVTSRGRVDPRFHVGEDLFVKTSSLFCGYDYIIGFPFRPRRPAPLKDVCCKHVCWLFRRRPCFGPGSFRQVEQSGFGTAALLH